jgi:hypothetical protein
VDERWAALVVERDAAAGALWLVGVALGGCVVVSPRRARLIVLLIMVVSAWVVAR